MSKYLGLLSLWLTWVLFFCFFFLMFFFAGPVVCWQRNGTFCAASCLFQGVFSATALLLYQVSRCFFEEFLCFVIATTSIFYAILQPETFRCDQAWLLSHRFVSLLVCCCLNQCVPRGTYLSLSLYSSFLFFFLSLCSFGLCNGHCCIVFNDGYFSLRSSYCVSLSVV